MNNTNKTYFADLTIEHAAKLLTGSKRGAEELILWLRKNDIESLLPSNDEDKDIGGIGDLKIIRRFGKEIIANGYSMKTT